MPATRKQQRHYCAPCRDERNDRIEAIGRRTYGPDRKRTYVCQACVDEDRAAESESESEGALLRKGYAAITTDDIEKVTRYAARIVASERSAYSLGITTDDVVSAALESIARSLVSESESESESDEGAKRYVWGSKRVDRAALRRFAVRRAIGHAVTRAKRAAEALASLESIASEEGSAALESAFARAAARSFDRRDSVYAAQNRTRGAGFVDETLSLVSERSEEALRAFDAKNSDYSSPLGRPARVLREAASEYTAAAPSEALSSRFAAIALADETLTDRPVSDPGTASEGSTVGIPLLRFRERPIARPIVPNAAASSARGSSLTSGTRDGSLLPVPGARFRPTSKRDPLPRSEGALTREAREAREAREQHAALESTRALRSALAALESSESDEGARAAAERVRALRAAGATSVARKHAAAASSGAEDRFARKQ